MIAKLFKLFCDCSIYTTKLFIKQYSEFIVLKVFDKLTNTTHWQYIDKTIIANVKKHVLTIKCQYVTEKRKCDLYYYINKR